MKKIVLGILILAGLWGTTAFAAEKEIKIQIQGEDIVFTDAMPFIDEAGRVQIPIGVLASAIGYHTGWQSELQTANLLYGSQRVNIKVGENKLENFVHAETVKTVEMDTVAIIKEDRVYIPLRSVGEVLGYDVVWQSNERLVQLNSGADMTNATDNMKLTFDLMEKMPKDKNYVVSPISLQMAMAMAANGADGNTRQEILDAMSIGTMDSYNAFVRQYLGTQQWNQYVSLELYNGIWVNTDFDSGGSVKFSDAYKQLVKQDYNGEVGLVNNNNGADVINGWIEGKTKGLTKDMLTKEDVADNLSFIVNTAYFKGQWDYMFKTENNYRGSFTDRNGKKSKGEFMSLTAHHYYAENENFEILAKRYNASEIQMYFVLPKTSKSITVDELKNAIASMNLEYVDFQLPKFKTETNHDAMTDILKEMGIHDAFEELEADFSNMYSGQSSYIYVEKVIQNTTIEVNERGTSASAGTFIANSYRSLPPEPIAFICDRPFTYFIMDDTTGTILFVGEYAFAE